jgi:hypothetical protein
VYAQKEKTWFPKSLHFIQPHATGFAVVLIVDFTGKVVNHLPGHRFAVLTALTHLGSVSGVESLVGFVNLTIEVVNEEVSVSHVGFSFPLS